MRALNDLEATAKKEHDLIMVLEISLVGIALILTFIVLNNIYGFSIPLMIETINYSVITYGIFLIIIGFIGSTLCWRWFRIPPDIKSALASYYTTLGYSTKTTLFQRMKVAVSNDLFFNIKIHFYKRRSGEACLINLESMQLPDVLKNEDQFKQIGERFFLSSDVATQKYSTTSEIEEIHLRSLLMTQALEEFHKSKN